MSGKGWGVEELVEKAESLIATYEHELAVKFYKKALDIGMLTVVDAMYCLRSIRR